MNKHIALAILIALGGATTVLAETQEEQQACTNDALQFCQAAIPDRNAVFNCLAANRTQISPACRTVMTQYLPAEPVPVKSKVPATPAAKNSDKTADKSAKNKAPLNITPH